MKISNGIAMLTLKVQSMGRESILHPTVLWDEDNVILVDTGVPESAPLIKEAMEIEGVAFEKLNHIIITHQDVDHFGSLSALYAEHPTMTTYAHSIDKPYIEGEKSLVKLTQERMETMLATLPPMFHEQIKQMFTQIPTGKIRVTLEDKQKLPFAGGISVCFTPGHTPGHISLYHHASKTLIAADALVAEDGKLMGPNPMFTPDMETAIASISKFADYDIQRIICYHGGLVEGEIQTQLEQILFNNNTVQK